MLVEQKERSLVNCVYDQPVFICTDDRDEDGGQDSIYLALLRGAITSSVCQWKGRQWGSLAELCDGDGLYLGVEAIDF